MSKIRQMVGGGSSTKVCEAKKPPPPGPREGHAQYTKKKTPTYEVGAKREDMKPTTRNRGPNEGVKTTVRKVYTKIKKPSTLRVLVSTTRNQRGNFVFRAFSFRIRRRLCS